MPRIWVVNASPVIVLAKVGAMDLVSQLNSDFVIPSTVCTEIEQGGSSDPACRWIRIEGAKRICETTMDDRVKPWDLGLGESSVISHCLTVPDALAVIDDGAARKCARLLNIRVLGTLGIIIAAKSRRLIPNASAMFDAVMRAGLRVGRTQLEECRRLAGEK